MAPTFNGLDLASLALAAVGLQVGVVFGMLGTAIGLAGTVIGVAGIIAGGFSSASIMTKLEEVTVQLEKAADRLSTKPVGGFPANIPVLAKLLKEDASKPGQPAQLVRLSLDTLNSGIISAHEAHRDFIYELGTRRRRSAHSDVRALLKPLQEVRKERLDEFTVRLMNERLSDGVREEDNPPLSQNLNRFCIAENLNHADSCARVDVPERLIEGMANYDHAPNGGWCGDEDMSAVRAAACVAEELHRREVQNRAKVCKPPFECRCIAGGTDTMLLSFDENTAAWGLKRGAASIITYWIETRDRETVHVLTNAFDAQWENSTAANATRDCVQE